MVSILDTYAACIPAATSLNRSRAFLVLWALGGTFCHQLVLFFFVVAVRPDGME
jgi:hypothetical protein